MTKAAICDPDPYWGEGETRTLRSYPEANNRLQRLQPPLRSGRRYYYYYYRYYYRLHPTGLTPFLHVFRFRASTTPKQPKVVAVFGRAKSLNSLNRSSSCSVVIGHHRTPVLIGWAGSLPAPPPDLPRSMLGVACQAYWLLLCCRGRTSPRAPDSLLKHQKRFFKLAIPHQAVKLGNT